MVENKKAVKKKVVKKNPAKKKTGRKYPPVPSWAKGYIGGRFDASASTETWYDQGSPQYHYALPCGEGLWVYKFTVQECGCPHCWWRFVLVALNPEKIVESIFVQVHELYNDGHAEILATDLLAGDIDIARAELDRVIKKK